MGCMDRSYRAAAPSRVKVTMPVGAYRTADDALVRARLENVYAVFSAPGGAERLISVSDRSREEETRNCM